ncbi:LysM peptidoglycan-binding domain-containing protein [uncultured Clostridium sp.]
MIADFNNIQNPYIKLKVGQELRIPIFNEVTFKEII